METPVESVRARVSSVTFYNVTQVGGRWWGIWVVGIVPVRGEDVETLIAVQACQPPLGGSMEPPCVNAPTATELNFLRWERELRRSGGLIAPLADAAEKDLFDLTFRTRDRRLLSTVRVEEEHGLIFQPLFPAQVVCQGCSPGEDGRCQQQPPPSGSGGFETDDAEEAGAGVRPGARSCARGAEAPDQLDVYIRTPRGDVFTYSTEAPNTPSPVPFRDILRPAIYEVDLASSDGSASSEHRVSLKILTPAGGFESWLVNSWGLAGGGLYAFLRSIYASCYAEHRGPKPVFYLLDPDLCPGGSDFQPYVPGFPFLPIRYVGRARPAFWHLAPRSEGLMLLDLNLGVAGTPLADSLLGLNARPGRRRLRQTARAASAAGLALTRREINPSHVCVREGGEGRKKPETVVGRAEAAASLEADATWWLYELALRHLPVAGAPVETPEAGGQARDVRTWLRALHHYGTADTRRALGGLYTAVTRTLLRAASDLGLTWAYADEFVLGFVAPTSAHPLEETLARVSSGGVGGDSAQAPRRHSSR
ncbi:BBLF2 [Macacine gammaherpesvirus 4]|uniref:BBLF2 n=1 Tax=Macacine gammaherpesvirus 4 TaxID=45455 RepID=Q8UZG3_9GAMA|nr:BBLF2 [Macacine gammaherpesvirus 4]AAK95448.1 BBLF2 [Macacine gammaherpesvirus 4]